MEGRKLYLRLAAMFLLLAALVFAVVVRLYDLQIIHGKSYFVASEKRLTRTVEVTATRGEIVDRYGRKLVTNRICYNVSFDPVLFPKERRNELIAELISICEERGIAHTDTLPILLSPRGAARYAEGDLASGRLAKWAAAMDFGVDASAQELFDGMRAEYEISEDLSAAEARKIVGVRYEIDLRTARIGLNIPSYVFAKDIPAEAVAVIKERDLPGVNIDTVMERQYETDCAAHLIGRSGPIQEQDMERLLSEGYAMDDTVGNSGAEKAFESWLRGKKGRKIEERSIAGKVTSVMYEEEARGGYNIILTIDSRLQEAAEKSLAARIEEIRRLGEAGSNQGAADAAGGAAVVLDVNTFEILAAANYPTYSLKTFQQDFAALNTDPLTPMVNRAFSGHYTPGSTFKMSTALAALETGAITRSTRITDRGIYTYYAPSYTPMCEIYLTQRGTHGTINVVDAIRVSCNYFFYEAGRLTGIERMNYYGRLLGLGQSTGVELPEYTGILAGPEEREEAGGVWNPGDTIAAAIGQSDNQFSPLQLACYVATLANGGTRKAAHLLKAVKTSDYSDTVFENTGEVLSELNADPENLEAILKGMLAVSTSGSAVASFGHYPVQVGTKTGTAQIGTGSPNGVFVAFAPYNDPQVAVAVVVEHAGKGSRIGMIARDILDAYFRTDESLGAVTAEGQLIN